MDLSYNKRIEEILSYWIEDYTEIRNATYFDSWMKIAILIFLFESVTIVFLSRKLNQTV